MSEDKIQDVYERRIYEPDYDVEDIRQRYLRLYTALIYDAMESIGLPGRSMSSGVYPLTIDMKVAGPALHHAVRPPLIPIPTPTTYVWVK